MMNRVTASLVIIAFLHVAGHSCSARLLGNDLFNVPANPSALAPSLNESVADGHMEKEGVQCGQELSRWMSSSVSSKNSVNEGNKLPFRLRPTIQNTKTGDELLASKVDEGVLILTGGHSLQANSMQMTTQRLSTSSRSPGVGHMQIIRDKSKSRTLDIIKSGHSNGDAHLRQNKHIKRKLRSTPSPGVGN